MARDNMTLGRFRLEGIPPAPRGVPQVEVDVRHRRQRDPQRQRQGPRHGQGAAGHHHRLDAPGQGAGGAHGARGRAARRGGPQAPREIEARNRADSLVYATEKGLKDYGEKVARRSGTKIETALNDLKEALKGEDIERIRTLTQELEQASYRMAEAMYAGTGQARRGRRGRRRARRGRVRRGARRGRRRAGGGKATTSSTPSSGPPTTRSRRSGERWRTVWRTARRRGSRRRPQRTPACRERRPRRGRRRRDGSGRSVSGGARRPARGRAGGGAGRGGRQLGQVPARAGGHGELQAPRSSAPTPSSPRGSARTCCCGS